ncbi:MAG: hypothetical protein R8K46_10605 [Mariprofundaceae bacterium]
MELSKVEQYARTVGLGGCHEMDKVDCIHAIQMRQGRDSCYGASWCVPCKHDNCLWREDCRAIKLHS